MGFATVDYAIVALYLVGVTVVGIRIAGQQRSSRDYFLGGKQMSWWSVGFSIVASETSTLTFISVPGLAYRGNMHFLQLAFGYFVGRLLVSVVFIPAYYRGDLETAYDFLGRRFGPSLRKFTSSVFLVTRVLASGVRLFATAIPVHLITGLSYAQSILLIGIFTLVYTYVGGLKAVVAMDVVQMFIYMSGAVASLALILHRLPGGWSDVVRFATQGGIDKFEVLNLSYGGSLMAFLSSPYTLLGGLLGGTFLTMASHGTDQLLVQRLLGCRSRWDAQRALMLDAAMIVAQFAFFLVLGVCLYAFYGGVSFPELGLSTSDEVFPKFIVENLPSGVAGLVVAGVLASAMGTLSSSISSLASSTYLDLFKATARGRSLTEKSEMLWSKAFTLFWGVVLIGGALLFTDSRNPVVELGLKIASFTYGGLLGTFFLGMLFPRVRERDAYFGFVAGILAMIVVLSRTSIDFTWHTLIGCVVTIAAGNASRLLLPGGKAVLGVAVAAISLAAPLEASNLRVWVTARDTGDRLAPQAPVPFEALEQPDEHAPTVIIDPSKLFQTIEGFGGALTDAAAETWAKLPAERQQELLTAYFDPERGIGYSLCRTHIHSCDFSSESYAYSEVPGDVTLQHFRLDHDRRYRLPFIRAALRAAQGPVKIFASPWSPPAWMKTNGSMLQGGRLKLEYREAWARYFVRFVEEYEKEGVPIWGLTVQNEPMATQTWESCLFTGAEERDFVRDYLGPALEKAGLSRLKLMIWDHNRGILFQRAKAVYDDPAAARYVWGAGFHWYVGDHFDNVRQVHDAWPDKQLLFTEGTPARFDAGALREWKWGEIYATSILHDLNNWAAGWTDWNVLLDERGGPNHVGNFCLAPVHGDTRTGQLTYTSSYWYIGHVSRFVRPGARRIACTSNDDDLLASAFAHPGGRVVTVVLNKTDAAKDVLLWMDGRAAKVKSPAHSILTLESTTGPGATPR